MKLIQERCTGCAYCVLVCPYDAIETDGWAEVIADRCADCILCYYACPNDCFVPDQPLKPYRPRVRQRYGVRRMSPQRLKAAAVPKATP